MTSWLSQTIASPKVQFVSTAVIASALSISVLLSYQKLRRDERVQAVKASIPNLSKDHIATQLTEWGGASETFKRSKEDERGAALALRARSGDYNDDLILEQLARNRVFLTDDGLAKLRSSFIIVVGCGGVGSHAVAALARSGVSHIRLIDFDQVTLSSLNRHAVATLADVGTPKVHCLRKRLEQIVPWTHFECLNELFSEQAASRLLSPSDGKAPDYVIDAIDNIDSKVALLHYCKSNSLRVVSSMGAGCKSDPTRIFLGDISTSTDDPLSRSTRRRLRILGVKEGVPVVYSSEKTGPGKAQLLPLPEEEFEKGKVNELGVLPDFRIRILPVLGTMPAMFGLVVANHVILEITGYPHDYLAGKGRDKMCESILQSIQASEERLARARELDSIGIRVPLSPDDVSYLLEEVFRSRSIVSGLTSRLTLSRWYAPPENFIDESVKGQRASTLRLRDLVCMTKDEASRHEREVLAGRKTPEELYDSDVLATLKSRLQDEAEFDKYR